MARSCRVRCPQHVHAPTDTSACLLPAHHTGEHRCRTDTGLLVAWQFDWDCACDDCRDDDWREWCVRTRVLPEEENRGASHG